MTDAAADSVEKPEVAETVLSEKTEEEVDALEEPVDCDDDVMEVETQNVPEVVDVISEDPGDHPSQRRRKVLRREDRPLTSEERHEIDDDIVRANKTLRKLEVDKKAVDKKYNGQIAEQRQALDDAIDILAKDAVFSDLVRMEVYDYEVGQVFYFDEAGEELVDERPMTQEERQTKMKM